MNANTPACQQMFVCQHKVFVNIQDMLTRNKLRMLSHENQLPPSLQRILGSAQGRHQEARATPSQAAVRAADR